jgi:hypothetical protein
MVVIPNPARPTTAGFPLGEAAWAMLILLERKFSFASGKAEFPLFDLKSKNVSP